MHKRFMAVTMFVLGALAMVVFQQVGQTAPALTALDYAEIDQLYARYAVAADTDIDDGDMYARVFTEDGVFDVTNPQNAEWPVGGIGGHEQLKAFAKLQESFRVENDIVNTPSHYLTNLLIEPTAEGAMGVAYHLGFAVEDTPDRAVYHDQLVKTPEGWRFKKRTVTWGGFGDDLLQALEREEET